MKKNSLKIVAVVVVILISGAFGLLTFSGFDAEDLGVLEEDVTFKIYEMKAMEIPIGWALEDSFITLKSDGTCIVSIKPKPSSIGLINSMLKDTEFDRDFLNDFSSVYLEALFPGFDLHDVDKSLGLVKDSLGIKFKGLDESSEEFVALRNQLQSGDKVSNIKLPEGISIEVKTVYNIKKVYTEDLGEYKAVYFGNYDDSYSKETFFIFTLSENNKQLKTRVEFLGLEIAAKQ